MRVVSLLPSATELVCLVGGEGALVGRSHECDYPASIRDRPILTGAKNPFKSCEQMNEAVTATLATGEGLYTIDEALLRTLAPDVIVTQSLCAVCSVDLRLVEQVVASMAADGGGNGSVNGAAAAAAAPSPPAAPGTPAHAAASGSGKEGSGGSSSADGPTQQQHQQQQQQQPQPIKPPRIVSLNPFTLEEVLQDALTVGEALGLQQEAAAAVEGLRQRVAAASALVARLPPLQHPVVAFLEWFEPLFPGGHWTPQLIEMAGGQHPLNPCRPGGGGAPPSYAVYNDQLVALDPDWIIICPCGLDMDETLQQLPPLVASGFWHNLKAVRNGRVVLVDGNAMFNRPGPRLVDCLEFLVGLLHQQHEAASIIPRGFPWRFLDPRELDAPVAAWLAAHPGWETRVQQGPKEQQAQGGGGGAVCCGPGGCGVPADPAAVEAEAGAEAGAGAEAAAPAGPAGKTF